MDGHVQMEDGGDAKVGGGLGRSLERVGGWMRGVGKEGEKGKRGIIWERFCFCFLFNIKNLGNWNK